MSDLEESDDFGAFFEIKGEDIQADHRARGRHSEEIIDRCTPCDIDRQRSVQKHVWFQPT